MAWRGGEPPLAILFLFFAKSVTFRGVFFIDAIFVQKVSQYHPLILYSLPSGIGAYGSRTAHLEPRRTENVEV